MSKRVVLLSDAVHGVVPPALSDILGKAGVTIEIRSAQEEAADGDGVAEPPLAVLYEVAAGADTLQLHAAVERTLTTWPGTPLVACRSQSNNYAARHLPVMDAAMLKRLGFNAIADQPTQLPALLRELEEHEATDDFQRPNHNAHKFAPGVPLLPPNIKASSVRAAFELVASLHFAGEQKSAANMALAALAPLVHADRWAIYLISETRGTATPRLEPLAASGITTNEREIPESDWRRALMSGAIVLSGTGSKAAREAVLKQEIIRKTEAGWRVVAVPLISGERILGVLEAVREGRQARAFSKPDTALLGALAMPIAHALANSVRIAEAERLSQTDDLTKLHNARYLSQALVGEIKRARRYGSSVAALFLDLDNFKGINDVYGHLVGSHVLMEMAAVMLSSVRDTDVVARYGGDEFVVVLPETGFEQAQIVAERIRDKVSRYVFTGGRSLRLQLTASFGMAVFPQHAQSPQQLIACADSAMYEAKAAGKNCLRTPQPPR